MEVILKKKDSLTGRERVSWDLREGEGESVLCRVAKLLLLLNIEGEKLNQSKLDQLSARLFDGGESGKAHRSLRIDIELLRNIHHR